MDPWLLWSRALCVGLVAFGFGVVGHVSADGLLPGPSLLTALGASTVLLSGPLLSRPAGRLRLVLMLVGGQALIHLTLTLSAGHRGDAAASGTTTGPPRPLGTSGLPSVEGRRVGSLHEAYQGMSGAPEATTPALPVGHLVADVSAHAPMMLAHLAAAAAVGLWLAHGERCLWTLLALTGRRLLAVVRALAVVPVVPQPAPAAPAARTQVEPSSQWQTRTPSRRGPPVALASTAHRVAPA